MRREAITLVLAMAVGTVLMAACDQPDKPTVPVAARQTQPNPNNVDTSLPSVALGVPTEERRKQSEKLMQRQVDTKQPAQTKDFDQKNHLARASLSRRLQFVPAAPRSS